MSTPSLPKKGVPIRRPDAVPAMNASSGGGSLAGALGEHPDDVHDEAEQDAQLEAALQRASISAGRFTVDGLDEEDEQSGDDEHGAARSTTRGSNDRAWQQSGAGTESTAASLPSTDDIDANVAGRIPIGSFAAAPSAADGAEAPPPISAGRAIDPARLADPSLPVCIIMIGMAGSGKTTLLQRLNAEAHMRSSPSYIVNLDPAVAHVPYGPNIDIRDTVNYKEVMKQYGLGPNGGIVTALNLFATRFDQVMGLLESRAPTLK